MSHLFRDALARRNKSGTPPVWFMRQAGRYHSHYQNLRRAHSFETLCRDTDLACEVTMGPIRDFDFDAAILFSDILFPIEAMGIGLKFDPGPKFTRYLKSPDDLGFYKGGTDKAAFMGFQAEALRKIRAALPAHKGLIGFVGGLLTLYIFAVDGSHKGDLSSSLAGLQDGRFEGFMEQMIDLLVANMVLQSRENIDCLAFMDSALGEITKADFDTLYMPWLEKLFHAYRRECPDMPVLFYGKNITQAHWEKLTTLPIQGLGIDHTLELPQMIERFGNRFACQGNFPPEMMAVAPELCAPAIDAFLAEMKQVSPALRQGWICGLGHGMIPSAYEENVRIFIEKLRAGF